MPSARSRTTICSPRSSSSFRRSRRPSRVPRASAGAGVASSPPPASSAASTPTIAAKLPSSGSSPIPYATSPSCLHWMPPIVSPRGYYRGRYPAVTTSGLVLVFLPWQNQFMVWDSVSDDQHHIDVPLGFGMGAISGAVVRAAGLVQHFQVVLVGPDKKRRGLACVFSSKTGAWGNLISTPLPLDYAGSSMVVRELPSVLAGNSLYWLLSERILKFDLDRQGLTMITLPPLSFHDRHNNTHFRVMRAEGGGLGFLFLSGFTTELWRKIDFDGVASWMLERTIELDKVLPPGSVGNHLWMLGLAENNNVFLLMTAGGLSMVHLQSLQLEHLDGYKLQQYLPFESVYTASNTRRV